MEAKMVELSMVFKYMQLSDVFSAFDAVNERVRAVLNDVDSDPFYQQTKPKPQAVGTTPETYIQHDTWRDAFDYWMSDHLNNAQTKSDEWMQTTVTDTYPKAVDKDNTLTAQEKTQKKTWAVAHRQSGLFRQSVIAFGDQYSTMMGTNWKVR